MKSKAWSLLIIGGLLLAGVGFFFFQRNKTSEIVAPLSSQPQPSVESLAQETLLTWNDQAGFTFQYESGLEIDKHPEDEVNYANLEITKDKEQGRIVILAADTKLKTISQWQPKAVEAVLGGKPAGKITELGKTTIAAIDDQILFTIEMDSAGLGSWQKRFDKIVESFEFVYPTAAPASSGEASDFSSGIIEEEEILQ